MNPKIEFLCLIPGVKESYPISSIKHYKPQWLHEEATEYARLREEYKQDPMKIIENGRSIAKCLGIRAMFNTGWVIPTWQDIIIDKEADSDVWSWKTPIAQESLNSKLNSYVNSHDPNSFRKCPHLSKKTPIVKIESPWIARVPDGYSLMQVPIPYQEHDLFSAAGGIFPSSMGYMEVNVQLLWNTSGRTLIPAGTPLAHLVLLKNEGIEDEVRDISTLEEKVWTAQKTIRNSVYERNYADIKEAIARTFKALDE